MKAERKVTKDSPCCCVIVEDENGENPCNGFTSGPDEPFCHICDDRHPNLGETYTVTQRLPEVAM